MCKKLKKDNIQKRSDVLHNNEYELLGIYEGYDIPIRTLHKKCGYEWDMNIKNHLNDKKRNGCPKCAGNLKLTSSSFQKKSNEIHNNEYTLISEYVSIINPVILEHNKCGFTFKVRGDNHLYNKTGCPRCNGGVKSDILDIQTKLNMVYSDEYKIIEYNGYDKKSVFIHKVCNTKVSLVTSSLINLTTRCECIGNIRWNEDKFIQSSKKIHNNEYELLNNFSNMNSSVLLKHLNCGNTFTITAKKHIYSKQGCSICKSSHGEKEIIRILNKYNIKNIHQHSFIDCKNQNKLLFDFYLPEYNMCIEYDGIQHFEAVNFFGGEVSFDKRKKNDNIKNEYCVNNNIYLIRISYLDKDIESILLNRLSEVYI